MPEKTGPAVFLEQLERPCADFYRYHEDRHGHLCDECNGSGFVLTGGGEAFVAFLERHRKHFIAHTHRLED